MMVENKPEGKQVVDKFIKYENGNMTNEETIKFFQELIDSGMAWKLQGHYGRTAVHLLEEGLCSE
jgi:polyhydroxyalkanoate synthesis regulator phasin